MATIKKYNNGEILSLLTFSDDEKNKSITLGSRKLQSGSNIVDSHGYFHTLNKSVLLAMAKANNELKAIKNNDKLIAVIDDSIFVVERNKSTVVSMTDDHSAKAELDKKNASILSIALSTLLDNEDIITQLGVNITTEPTVDAIINIDNKLTGKIIAIDDFTVTLLNAASEEGKAKIAETKEAIRTASDTYRELSGYIPTPDNFFKFEETEKESVVDETTMDDIYRFDKTEWDMEAQALIPDIGIYNSYIKDKPFYRMANLVSNKTRLVASRIDDGGFLKSNAELLGENGSGAINLLIYGPPGSGKTQAIDALAAFMNIPVYRISGTDKAEDGDIKGKAGIDEHGNFKNIITVARKAIENGGILCIEEYNLMPPALFQGILGQTVVYPYKLLTNEETYVDRHPHCIIALTKNTNTEGTVEQNQAFNNRFTMRYFPEQQEEVFVNLITRYDTGFGKADKKTAKMLYKVYTKLADFVASSEIGEEELALELSLRTCYHVLEDMYCAGSTMAEAVKEQLGGHINHNNPEIGKIIFDFIDGLL